MCNEYAREIALAKLQKEFSRLKQFPKFEWLDQRIPNDVEEKASIKIHDAAPIMRLQGDVVIGTTTTWAWLGPHGKPVFNFVSEGRDFSRTERVLIPATGFYEYTTPEAPKVRLKDKHIFTMHHEEWFWIAGIVKNDCFTMLTTAPGPDIAAYHDRQIITLAPSMGLDWLTLSRPQKEILAASPAGRLSVRTLRKDGMEV